MAVCDLKKRGAETDNRFSPGKVLMALGLAMILGAGAICAYNIWDESRAEAASQKVLTGLLPEIPVSAGSSRLVTPITAASFVK